MKNGPIDIAVEKSTAQTTLEFQATQLRTAYHINMATVSGRLDLDTMLDAVLKALIKRADFVRVELSVSISDSDIQVERNVVAGSDEVSWDDVHSIPIESTGRVLGSLRFWPQPGAEIEERYALLDFIVPTIAVAIQNALQFTILSDYRVNLEQKVVDRTAELSKARDELSATIDDLKAAQATRDRIFDNINHEIRTPLSLIILATQGVVTLDQAILSQRSMENLAAIDGGSRKLLRLIDELLLLAASQESKLNLQKEGIDLGHFLQQTVAAWRPAAEVKSLTLSFEDGPTDCLVFADRLALDRIVSNLVSNALKFTPAEGRILISLRTDSATAVFTVSDTGPGIDDEFMKRIFGRFEQAKEGTRAVQGSGIGLSLVKELAEAHGGTATVANGSEGGATFTVTLPLASMEQVQTARSNATNLRLAPSDYGVDIQSSREHVSEANPGAATVLVVEDDSALRSAIAQLLATEYRVIVAADGPSALAQAQKELPDVLVSDIGLPGFDGYELAKRFRCLPGNRLSPIILLTAYGALEDRLAGFDSGAVDYVTKPFDPAELRARIASQLAIRRMAISLNESDKRDTLGLLSSGLAHELRNPANGIINALTPLRALLPPEVTVASHPVAQLLNVVEAGAKQVAVMSRQLLGFRESGSFGMARESLLGIVDQALTLVRPNYDKVTYINQIREDISLDCSAAQITQVLVNLFENGAHAVKQTGTVTIAARADEYNVLIDVADNGPGVPNELRERIFAPFFTTKDPGKGTGLGLYTSRDIALKHHGNLELISRDGGAIFRVTLPLLSTSAMAKTQSMKSGHRGY